MSHRCNCKCKWDKLIKMHKHLIKITHTDVLLVYSWSVYTNKSDVDWVWVAKSVVFLDNVKSIKHLWYNYYGLLIVMYITSQWSYLPQTNMRQINLRHVLIASANHMTVVVLCSLEAACWALHTCSRRWQSCFFLSSFASYILQSYGFLGNGPARIIVSELPRLNVSRVLIDCGWCLSVENKKCFLATIWSQ